MTGATAGTATESTAQRAARLAARHDGVGGLALLRAMILEEFPGRIAVVSSFGTESALILALVAQIDPAVPVIFLETGKHFDETLAYRDELAARLGLRDLRSIRPEPAAVQASDPGGDLWRRDADRCCHIRKVLPLERALTGFSAWITGRKRFHGGERTALPHVEAAGLRIKVNPLAGWSTAQMEAAFEVANLPRHPLVEEGYTSIGCAPCTQRPTAGADPRAGRWAGSTKTECGIHWPAASGC